MLIILYVCIVRITDFVEEEVSSLRFLGGGLAGFTVALVHGSGRLGRTGGVLCQSALLASEAVVTSSSALCPTRVSKEGYFASSLGGREEGGGLEFGPRRRSEGVVKRPGLSCAFGACHSRLALNTALVWALGGQATQRRFGGGG